MRQNLCKLSLVDEPAFEQKRAQTAAIGTLEREDFVEVGWTDEFRVDEQLAESNAHVGHG